MSPYREAGLGAPSDDPLFVEPGKGLRGIWVGRATVEDVLRVFGDDCYVNESGGEILSLGYDYGKRRELDAGRPAQRTRPASFDFEFGLLDQISMSPYQSELFTTGGVRVDSSRAEVLRTFGEPDEIVVKETFEKLWYHRHGIELVITRDGGKLLIWSIFRARR